MAQTWRSKHLQVEQAADDALREGVLSLIGPITRVLLRYATDTNADGQRILPYRPRVLEQASRDIWKEAIKPWFIGGGDAPLDEDGRPRSPFMEILVGGIAANTRVSVDETVAALKKVASRDIFEWLTGPRPVQAMAPAGLSVNSSQIEVVREQGPADPRKLWYDPFHKHIGAEDGYTLSDRGWRAAEGTRKAIDNLLAAEIAKGTSAVELADKLEPYLWPEAAKVRTVTPYGDDGSYWARRLARTEITAAAGRSLHNAALANVYVSGIKWNLSLSHPCCDICDELAAGGPDGGGVYPKDDPPLYPAHPHCVTPGQMVETISGPVPIELVQDGDIVRTHTRAWGRVLKAWSRPFDGTVYEFVTDWGAFELTGEHPVYLERGWVNAEDVQTGEQVLYAGVNVPVDVFLGEANDDPAVLADSRIASRIADGVMPESTVAFDRDLARHQREIDEVGADGELGFRVDAPPRERLTHSVFNAGRAGVLAAARSGAAEVLVSVRLLDLEGLAAIPADENNRSLPVDLPAEGSQVIEARIVPALGFGNLTPDLGALGGIGVTATVSPPVQSAPSFAGDLASGPVVERPGGADGLTAPAHGDAAVSQQPTQHAERDAERFVERWRGHLPDGVVLDENGGNRATELLFESEGVVLDHGNTVYPGVMPMVSAELSLSADGALVTHDSNLSSLPLGTEWGTAPRNAGVGRFMRPSLAQLHYTPIREIRTRHYQGPVYNMHVEGDNSYTVNGACVHNCICYLTQELTAHPTDIENQIRLWIEEEAPEALALRGAFNPDWLTGALLNGDFIGTVLDGEFVNLQKLLDLAKAAGEAA